MKVKGFWIALMVMVCISIFSTAYANEKPPAGPQIFGELNAAVIDETAGDDWHFQAVEASVGVKGFYVPKNTKAFKMFYRLELDLTDVINDGDEDEAGEHESIDVKNAQLVFFTKLGKFIANNRADSKHHEELYGVIDQFEIFEADRNGGLFDQPKSGTGGLIWNSPVFKGFYVAYGTMNLNDVWDDNDEDQEGWASRIMYKKKNIGEGTWGAGTFRAGIGYASISDAITTTVGPLPGMGLEAEKGYNRVAGTGQYLFDAGHNIGATYESITNHPVYGDFDTFGIAAKCQLPYDLSIKVAYVTQSGDQDNNAIVGQLAYQPTKQNTFYMEIADYDGSNQFVTGPTPGPEGDDRGFIGIGTKFVF